MSESLSGGTTHLLRMARSGCQSAVSFVALALPEDRFATATYPTTSDDETLGADVVEDLVRQLWLDPGLARGKALTRTVRLTGRWPASAHRRLAVAALPLGTDEAGRPWGLLGVADPQVTSFGVTDLEFLSRIAQRLASYVQARQEVRRQIAVGASVRATEPRAEEPGTDTEPEPWWPIEPTHEARGPGAAEPEAPRASSSDAPADAGTEGPPATNGHGAAAPPDDLDALFGDADAAKGLLPLAALLGRAGRLLGAGAGASGTLVVVALDVEGGEELDGATVAAVADALRADLRFDDPVARLGGTGFLAAVPVVPGGTAPDALCERLAASVRAALGAGASVRAAHAGADLARDADADELVRVAVGKLRAG